MDRQIMRKPRIIHVTDFVMKLASERKTSLELKSMSDYISRLIVYDYLSSGAVFDVKDVPLWVITHYKLVVKNGIVSLPATKERT